MRTIMIGIVSVHGEKLYGKLSVNWAHKLLIPKVGFATYQKV